jgi:hypothetical protein
MASAVFENLLVQVDTVTRMPQGQGLRALSARLASWAVAVALLAMPTSAAAIAGPPSGLSPRLAELSKISDRTASQADLAAKLGLAPGDGDMARQGNRVLAYVRFDYGAVAALDQLRGTGAKIVDVSRRYQTITVAAKPGELRDIAGVARVAGVSPVHAPIVAGAGTAGPVASVSEPCFGAATSEGDLQLSAMAARDGFEVDGSGVKVGILSDSFNRDKTADTSASMDVKTGDLPGPENPCGYTTPVQVLDDSAVGGEDEGRAMAQIVHDLAPGASLAFATAFKDELSFAKNIVKLAEAGATVIADDVFYTEEPFFQDGPIAVAVNEVVEGGATYFSAAGNDNLVDNQGRDIASWEAPAYRDSGSCPASLVALSEEIEELELTLELEGPGTGLHPEHCMDFNPGPGKDQTFGITVSNGATLFADLQWAEPREGVSDNIDAYLLNAKGEAVTGSIESNIAGTQQPVELIEWENDTGAKAQVQLVINRYKGTENPPLKFALLQNGGGVTATEYPESSGGDTVGSTIFGHSGAASAVGVGAVPFNDSEEPEEYSSHGPVTHYFGPVTGSNAPAEPIAGSPEVIAKPDVVATDGGANTFFGFCQSHVWRFYGTSAAAPHAAAVAALEREADPLATPEEVRQAQTENTLPVGAFPPEAVGAGLVDAPEAISGLLSVGFPGGTQFAPPEPENCNLPSPPGPSPSPTGPSGPQTSTNQQVPTTFFRHRPPRVILTRKRIVREVFRFGSDESGATFACRIDGGLFRVCPERLVRRFGVGLHTLRVVARDASGDGDRTPAVYRFRVKRIS